MPSAWAAWRRRSGRWRRWPWAWCLPAAEAITAFRAALDRGPGQSGWRLELARLFHEQGQLREACLQLQIILGHEPANAEARALLLEVTRQLAEAR